MSSRRDSRKGRGTTGIIYTYQQAQRRINRRGISEGTPTGGHPGDPQTASSSDPSIPVRSTHIKSPPFAVPGQKWKHTVLIEINIQGSRGHSTRIGPGEGGRWAGGCRCNRTSARDGGTRDVGSGRANGAGRGQGVVVALLGFLVLRVEVQKTIGPFLGMAFLGVTDSVGSLSLLSVIIQVCP